MLSNLMERLNKDSNFELQRNSLSECGIISSNMSEFEKNSLIQDNNLDVSDLKERLLRVTLSDTDTIEQNAEKILSAARSTDSLLESVISTNKMIQMDKNDYEEFMDIINNLKKDNIDKSERKVIIKKIKSFLKAVIKELSTCNDDSPADALVLACVHKLCKIYNIDYKFINTNKEKNNKEKLVEKINLLAKNVK